MNLKLIFIVILSSLAVIFITQNFAIVEISFLYGRAYISSALLIFLALTVGFLLGWFMHSHLLHRKYKGISL